MEVDDVKVYRQAWTERNEKKSSTIELICLTYSSCQTKLFTECLSELRSVNCGDMEHISWILDNLSWFVM